MTINLGPFVLLAILCAFAWWAWGLAGAIAVALAYGLSKFEDRLQ